MKSGGGGGLLAEAADADRLAELLHEAEAAHDKGGQGSRSRCRFKQLSFQT